MGLDMMSKQVADRQFDPGYDDPIVDQPVTCDGCDGENLRLTDYYGGRLKTPLMLCSECCIRKAELSQARSDADFYGGSSSHGQAQAVTR